MRRVALTGGIATGKSHVRAQFEQLGVATIDADVLARDAVAPGAPALTAIAERFGRDLIDPNGVLDRRKLGSIVFSDPVARRDLEEIIHPAVRSAIDAWFQSLGDSALGFAIADIPLLYETGRDRDFDTVIVVSCPGETQVARIMARDGMTEADARARIAAQLPIEEKIRRADYVIRTDGTFEQTNRKVIEVFERLRALGVGRRP